MAILPDLSSAESWYEENLLVKRNRAMAGRVIQILGSDPGSSHFFAFGVAHFLGQQSIVQLLRDFGVEVERVGVEEELETLRQISGGERSASDIIIILCLPLLAIILI